MKMKLLKIKGFILQTDNNPEEDQRMKLPKVELEVNIQSKEDESVDLKEILQKHALHGYCIFRPEENHTLKYCLIQGNIKVFMQKNVEGNMDCACQK